MWTLTANFQHCSSFPIPSISTTSRSSCSRARSKPTLICSSLQTQVETLNGTLDGRLSERTEIRFGLPSKGRMASDTLDLLKVLSSVSFLFCFCHFSCEFFSLFDSVILSGLPGLSIVCKTSQSSAVCCKDSAGTC